MMSLRSMGSSCGDEMAGNGIWDDDNGSDDAPLETFVSPIRSRGSASGGGAGSKNSEAENQADAEAAEALAALDKFDAEGHGVGSAGGGDALHEMSKGQLLRYLRLHGVRVPPLPRPPTSATETKQAAAGREATGKTKKRKGAKSAGKSAAAASAKESIAPGFTTVGDARVCEQVERKRKARRCMMHVHVCQLFARDMLFQTLSNAPSNAPSNAIKHHQSITNQLPSNIIKNLHYILSLLLSRLITLLLLIWGLSHLVSSRLSAGARR